MSLIMEATIWARILKSRLALLLIAIAIRDLYSASFSFTASFRAADSSPAPACLARESNLRALLNSFLFFVSRTVYILLPCEN